MFFTPTPTTKWYRRFLWLLFALTVLAMGKVVERIFEGDYVFAHVVLLGAQLWVIYLLVGILADTSNKL